MKQSSSSATKRSSTLSVVHKDTAALDIGAREIYACVPSERDEQNVRSFATLTPELYQLANWLVRCQIKSVAMEMTEVYWVPIFEILEACGIEVYLVDTRQLKQVPGRKSDVADCQWLQQLHTFGLLRPCFQTEEEMLALRTLVRQSKSILLCRATHDVYRQIALHMIDKQLTQLVNDINGKTAMRILRTILARERNPLRLARLRADHSGLRIAKNQEAYR